MSLDPDEYEKLTDILNDAHAHEGQLSDWERGFIADFQTRVDQYGDNTRVSSRQWEILDRIRDKL